MKTNMTGHAFNDRMARFEYIVDTVGIGKITARYQDVDENNRIVVFELTTTGVIIVRNKDNMVVTAYIAEMKQAFKVWRSVNGNKKIPSSLYEKIRQNQRVRANQPC